MRFEVATPADDPEIRRLLRENPMGGAIRVSLEAEPSSFDAAAIQGDVHQLLVARDERDGKLVGMAGRTVLDAWIDGEPRRLGYLSQLRVDAAHRNSPRLLAAGNARFRALHGDGETPLYVTTILADNARARRVLERGLPGMPTYLPRGELVTLVLPTARRLRRGPLPAGLAVRPAQEEDLDAIVERLARHGRRHNFAPHWTKAALRSEERTRGLAARDFFVVERGAHLVGCLALWRQGPFKQAVVRGYDRRLRMLRPLHNLACPLTGAPRLPRPGVALRSAFLSHLAVDDDDPDVLLALVGAAHSRAVGEPIDYVHLGLSPTHPSFAPIAAAFPHRAYRSLLYLVHWEDGAEAARRIGNRPPHLEVAIL